MIKGIIFDLDGTLLDTISDIGDSVNQMLEDYGYPTFTYDEYKLKVGHGFKNLIERSLPSSADFDLKEEALAKFIYYYHRNYTNSSYPYPGIIETLHKLADRNIKLAINSNKADEYTNNLAKIRLSEIDFVAVLGQIEGIPKKPDPANALKIIKTMQLDPSEVVYIGDSATDIKTAKNAHLVSIGVAWGFRGEGELKEAGADHIAYRPSDIIDIINTI